PNPDRRPNATLDSSSMRSIDQRAPIPWRMSSSSQGGKILSNLPVSSEQLFECPGQGGGRASVPLRIATPHDRWRRRFAFVALKRAHYSLGCYLISDHRKPIEAPRSMELRHERRCRVMACCAPVRSAARLERQARDFRPERRYFSEQSR